MNPAELPAGSIKFLALLFRIPPFVLKPGPVPALEFHEFVHHRAELGFMRGGIETLGDLYDARLEA